MSLLDASAASLPVNVVERSDSRLTGEHSVTCRLHCIGCLVRRRQAPAFPVVHASLLEQSKEGSNSLVAAPCRGQGGEISANAPAMINKPLGKKKTKMGI